MLRKALSERLRAGDVVVVDELKLGSPKTKDFVGLSPPRAERDCALGGANPVRNCVGLAQHRQVALTTSDWLNTYDVLSPTTGVHSRCLQQVEIRLAKE